MLPSIVTVLRSGGEYTPEHVERLRRQCAERAPGHPFYCLSDVPSVADVPLRHGWPGWWSKIEVFRLRGPVLYMDLDTTILGDLSPLLLSIWSQGHEFIALRDFNPEQREMGSGLMGWSGSMRHVYERFLDDPDGHMARCQTRAAWGDQGFIEPLTPGRAYWQDIWPGMVVSWKKHCRNRVPEGARVICFHGKPRPWEVGQ